MFHENHPEMSSVYYIWYH